MSQLGTFITVDVDPEANDGLDQAAALVTGVYPDGSLRVRVFGSSSVQDQVRNHVGTDGQPYPYEEQNTQPVAAPAPSSPAQPVQAVQQPAPAQPVQAVQQPAPAQPVQAVQQPAPYDPTTNWVSPAPEPPAPAAE